MMSASPAVLVQPALLWPVCGSSAGYGWLDWGGGVSSCIYPLNRLQRMPWKTYMMIRTGSRIFACLLLYSNYTQLAACANVCKTVNLMALFSQEGEATMVVNGCKQQRQV
jgi:hypothetical protein